jgi:hypothetical protein
VSTTDITEVLQISTGNIMENPFVDSPGFLTTTSLTCAVFEEESKMDDVEHRGRLGSFVFCVDNSSLGAELVSGMEVEPVRSPIDGLGISVIDNWPNVEARAESWPTDSPLKLLLDLS